LEAANEAVRLGQPAHEVLALQTAARFGDRTVAERLARLAGAVQGPRVRAAAAHAAALAAGDGVGLGNASLQLEEMGDVLAAADAAAQAVAAFEFAGRSSRAAAASTRAQRLSEECEGALTPALVAVARPLPLTAREREVVSLAAQNLSNREIAARLYVSVRTVEGHLYNASVKLGTNSRRELATMLTGP
jgi:DNA-binding CsgD family transcriptional regulator